MKRISFSIFVVVFMIIFLPTYTLGITQSRLNRVCWVEDSRERQLKQEPGREERVTYVWKRTLHTYNCETGTYEDFDIPTSWDLIRPDSAEKDILFTRNAEIAGTGNAALDNRYSIDILRWRDGESTLLAESLFLEGYHKVLAFKKGYTYFLNRCTKGGLGSTYEYVLSKKKLATNGIYYGADVYKSMDTQYPSISDEGKVVIELPRPKKGEVATMVIETANINGIDTERISLPLVQASKTEDGIMYEDFSCMGWLDEDHVLLLARLSADSVPSIEIYYEQTYEGDFRDTLVKYPLHNVSRLLTYDIRTQEYELYLDDSGKTIDLIDYTVSSSYIRQGGDTLVLECRRDNPVFMVYFTIDTPNYILMVSLEDGEQTVIYESGYEAITDEEINKLWDYAAAEYNEPQKNGYLESRLPEEDQAIIKKIISPQLLDDTVPGKGSEAFWSLPFPPIYY